MVNGDQREVRLGGQNVRRNIILYLHNGEWGEMESFAYKRAARETNNK